MRYAVVDKQTGKIVDIFAQEREPDIDETEYKLVDVDDDAAIGDVVSLSKEPPAEAEDDTF